MKVTPSVSWIFISSNCVSSRSFLSSAPSGSSSSSSFGRLTRLRASATRCRWPPESWCGLRSANRSSCTSFSISATRSVASVPAHAVAQQPVGDVLLHAHVREERVGLEHHVGRPLVGRDAGHVLPVDLDPARGRRLEAREHPQQRRLAAARAAEQAEELALVDVEADIVDGGEVAELLADLLDADEGTLVAGDPGLGRGDRSPSRSCGLRGPGRRMVRAAVRSLLPPRTAVQRRLGESARQSRLVRRFSMPRLLVIGFRPIGNRASRPPPTAAAAPPAARDARQSACSAAASTGFARSRSCPPRCTPRGRPTWRSRSGR